MHACTVTHANSPGIERTLLTSALFPGLLRKGYFPTISEATLFLSSGVGCLLKANMALATPETNF